MSHIRVGRYVSPSKEPQAYVIVSSITRDGRVMIRFLNDSEHWLHPYDPNDLQLLPQGVVNVRRSFSVLFTQDFHQ